jgi:hypothetical protein
MTPEDDYKRYVFMIKNIKFLDIFSLELSLGLLKIFHVVPTNSLARVTFHFIA